MPDIQVTAERKREVLEAHRVWSRDLPRTAGQIGGPITTLVEGPPIYIAGEISAYSDYDPVRFIGVDESFAKFLSNTGIPFQLR